MNPRRHFCGVFVAVVAAAPVHQVLAERSGRSAESRPSHDQGAGFVRPGARGGFPARAARAWRGGPASAPADSLLTDEEIERLMIFMQRNFPMMYQRLSRVRERDPAQFQRMINRHARMLLPMLDAARNHPELARKMVQEHRARMEIQDLRERYARSSDPEQRAKLRQEMRQHMDVAFEARLERLRMEVQRLQQRLDEARKQLSRQEQNKSRLIDEHLEDVLSQSTP